MLERAQVVHRREHRRRPSPGSRRPRRCPRAAQGRRRRASRRPCATETSSPPSGSPSSSSTTIEDVDAAGFAPNRASRRDARERRSRRPRIPGYELGDVAEPIAAPRRARDAEHDARGPGVDQPLDRIGRLRRPTLLERPIAPSRTISSIDDRVRSEPPTARRGRRHESGGNPAAAQRPRERRLDCRAGKSGSLPSTATGRTQPPFRISIVGNCDHRHVTKRSRPGRRQALMAARCVRACTTRVALGRTL